MPKKTKKKFDRKSFDAVFRFLNFLKHSKLYKFELDGRNFFLSPIESCKCCHLTVITKLVSLVSGLPGCLVRVLGNEQSLKFLLHFTPNLRNTNRENLPRLMNLRKLYVKHRRCKFVSYFPRVTGDWNIQYTQRLA